MHSSHKRKTDVYWSLKYPLKLRDNYLLLVLQDTGLSHILKEKYIVQVRRSTGQAIQTNLIFSELKPSDRPTEVCTGLNNPEKGALASQFSVMMGGQG